MSSVNNGMSIGAQMGLGAFGVGLIGAVVGNLAIGLPLYAAGNNFAGCFLGGFLGGGACGAFLGGTATLVIAKVRQHMDQKNLPTNDPNIPNSAL